MSVTVNTKLNWIPLYITFLIFVYCFFLTYLECRSCVIYVLHLLPRFFGLTLTKYSISFFVNAASLEEQEVLRLQQANPWHI